VIHRTKLCSRRLGLCVRVRLVCSCQRVSIATTYSHECPCFWPVHQLVLCYQYTDTSPFLSSRIHGLSIGDDVRGFGSPGYPCSRRAPDERPGLSTSVIISTFDRREGSQSPFRDPTTDIEDRMDSGFVVIGLERARHRLDPRVSGTGPAGDARFGLSILRSAARCAHERTCSGSQNPFANFSGKGFRQILPGDWSAEILSVR
jgi:hypothetical protein